MIPSPRDPIEYYIENILGVLGEDTGREGLRKTPNRAAQALRFLTSGYELNLDDVVNDAIYKTTSQGTVLQRDLEVYSTCEHHLLPMHGLAHVVYIPDGHVIGLSKVPRIINMFARRLQLQEKLTNEIADALYEVLKPKALCVVLDLSHMCVAMRGAQQGAATTVTSEWRGESIYVAALKSDMPPWHLLSHPSDEPKE